MKSILKLSFFVALMAGFAFTSNAQTATTTKSEVKTEHKCSKDSKKACCKKGTATDAKATSKADAHTCSKDCTKACCADKTKVDPATGSSTTTEGGGTRKIAITEEGVPAVNEQASPTKAATTPKKN
jgi:hypothetical protein